MPPPPGPSPLRTLLLWLPVLLPLMAGAVALHIGLPYRDWDWVTLLLLLLASWGASVGVFSGWILAGMRLGQALLLFGLLLFTGPALNAVLTAAVGLPVAVAAFLLDASPQRMAVIALTCWFLVAAASGVEMLDRYLRRTALADADDPTPSG
jgi:hypothetical protein